MYFFSVCKYQDNAPQFSYAKYPSANNSYLLHANQFCAIATKLCQFTCKDLERRVILKEKHPKLCETIEKFDNFLCKPNVCGNWQEVLKQNTKEQQPILFNELHDYASQNVARLQVYVQAPFTTILHRDVEMTETEFIANMGGLISLFLGCSFISAFELIYWCCRCLQVMQKRIDRAKCNTRVFSLKQ